MGRVVAWLQSIQESFSCAVRVRQSNQQLRQILGNSGATNVDAKGKVNY